MGVPYPNSGLANRFGGASVRTADLPAGSLADERILAATSGTGEIWVLMPRR